MQSGNPNKNKLISNLFELVHQIGCTLLHAVICFFECVYLILKSGHLILAYTWLLLIADLLRIQGNIKVRLKFLAPLPSCSLKSTWAPGSLCLCLSIRCTAHPSYSSALCSAMCSGSGEALFLVPFASHDTETKWSKLFK